MATTSIATSLHGSLSLSASQLESLKLLALSSQELDSVIQDAVSVNPLLQTEEPSENGAEIAPEPLPFDTPVGVCANFERENAFFTWAKTDISPDVLNPIDAIEAPVSLSELLQKQLCELRLNQETHEAIQWLIGNLDENGFLSDSLESIIQGAPLKTTKATWVNALKTLQTLDPAGVAAANIEEALLLQITRSDAPQSVQTTAATIVPLLLKKRVSLQNLHHQLKLSETTVHAALQLIHRLSPYPASGLKTSLTGNGIIPEVLLKFEQGRPTAQLNDSAVTGLRFDHDTYELLKQSKLSGKDKTSWQALANTARLFIKSLEYRYSTIVSVAQAVVSAQEEFFLGLTPVLKPLTQKEIAQKLSVHESTVGRAVTGKYIQTPRGVMEIKSLFCNKTNFSQENDISVEKATETIRQIIQAEDPYAPLSDEKIAAQLEAQGIYISRRTVAKYRTEASIPSKSERKRR